MSGSIIILPESNDETLCLRLTGTVTLDDYTKYFDNEAVRIVERHGRYNLYVEHADDFQGWTQEAADASFRRVTIYIEYAKRLVYVNAPDSRMLLMRMMGPLSKAEIRYYDLDDRETGLRWVLTGEE